MSISILYITDQQNLNDYIFNLRAALQSIDETKQCKAVAVDTETTGLDPHKDRIRLIQLYVKGFSAVLVIDCFKVNNLSPVKSLLEDPSIKKIFQNAKFDLKFLRSAGINVKGQLFDTMVASQVLSCGIKQKHNLKELARRYLNIELSKEERKSDWGVNELTPEQLQYAAKDVIILPRLRTILCKELKDKDLVRVASIEFDCIYAVAEMEYSGIKLNLESWQKLKKEYKERKEVVRDLIFSDLRLYKEVDIFGEVSINLDSPAQMLSLFKKLNIPVPNTNYFTLMTFRNIPLIEKFMEYRKITKALSSFLEPLPEQINSVTGRVHPSYWQLGSAAGRFSCSDPNLQQIPRTADFRSCFIPEPGNLLVIADYSQIELRVAAEISKDLTMISAYKNNTDLHRLTASLVSGKSFETIGKEERQLAKALNFGLLYGMGAAGLAEYAKNSYGVEMSLQQAEEFKSKFFGGYSGLAKWHTKVRLQKAGKVKTLAGRTRKFPEKEKFTQTTRLNTPVQGTAADILKIALGKLPGALRGTGAQIVGTVHDEVLLECSEGRAEEVKEILQQTMESASFLQEVPVEAEAKICIDWGGK